VGFSGLSVGDLVSASVSCASGKVVLGGGARTTVTSVLLDDNIALRSSYPSAADTWTGVAVATGISLTGSVTVTAYALCSL
jgi:hypothetical protein